MCSRRWMTTPEIRVKGIILSAISPDTGTIPGTAVAAGAAATAQPRRRLGLALAVIATAQLMVVLDSTIVNVALPHIQGALGFSDSNLEWVVNAYTLAFGGLLLLGGRSGDLLGRRRIFIAGILVFALASLAGGFATDQAWLLAARVIQGVGGAMAAPTALSLIAVTFPEGPPRNRALGVYAAMSVAGAAVGLIAGGLLVNYLSWRWIMFVNVPIGLVVAALATRVLPESQRRAGRFDLPGAITGTLGITSLVYGLSNAATSASGVSHWGDTKVIVSLAAAVVLLVARIGARPLMITGATIMAGGMVWLSRITEHSSYAGGLLGPMMLTALGLGLVFVPLSLVSLTKVGNADAGVASSMLNVGQQVGGSIGLAVLGTVAWSAVASSLRSQAAAAAKAGHQVSGAKAAALQKAVTDHALATGFSKGFLVSAGIAVLALVITLVAIRVTRKDLAGVDPMAAPAG